MSSLCMLAVKRAGAAWRTVAPRMAVGSARPDRDPEVWHESGERPIHREIQDLLESR